jgi:hypothetical protein
MTPRGKCSRCRYSFRLRRNGTLQWHHLFCGSDRAPDACPGSGLAPWTDYSVSIVIDPNVRVRGDRAFSGYEDIKPGSATFTRLPDGLVRVGDKVLAVESEDRICTEAEVIGLNREHRLIYLKADWHGWRELEPA